MTDTESEPTTTTSQIGVDARVRVNAPERWDTGGLRARRHNGLEGTVVRLGFVGYPQDLVVRLDDQSGGYGWRDDDDTYCLHAPAECFEVITPAPPEPGVGSRVRFEVPAGESVRGLSHRTIHGQTGTVVSTQYSEARSHGDDWVVALDDPTLTVGWGGDEYGHPDSKCVHVPRENLVIIGHESTEPEAEPETPEFNEWRRDLYAKAVDLARTSYSGYMRSVENWLREVGIAPRAVTYRVSGDLKYETGRYSSSVPTLASVGQERLSNLPDVKLEVAEVTYPRRRPGQTVETTTADIFALVDRVVASGEVCDEAKVFVRRLGLRPPPRNQVTVKVELNLNSAELAQIKRAGDAGRTSLLNLIRQRGRDTRDPLIAGIEVVEPEREVEAKAKPTRARKSRARARTAEETAPAPAPTPEPAPELVVAV